jgi:hypothetical protein
LKNFKEILPFDHPLQFVAPIDPVGAPFNRCGLKYMQGRTNRGGILLPVADITATIVTFCSYSADVIPPTCFVFFCTNTSGGICTVVIVVS